MKQQNVLAKTNDYKGALNKIMNVRAKCMLTAKHFRNIRFVVKIMITVNCMKKNAPYCL